MRDVDGEMNKHQTKIDVDLGGKINKNAKIPTRKLSEKLQT